MRPMFLLYINECEIRLVAQGNVRTKKNYLIIQQPPCLGNFVDEKKYYGAFVGKMFVTMFSYWFFPIFVY